MQALYIEALKAVMWLLKQIKDSDGDGRIDLFDSEPQNPEVK